MFNDVQLRNFYRLLVAIESLFCRDLPVIVYYCSCLAAIQFVR